MAKRFEPGSLKREHRKELTLKVSIYMFLIVATLPVFLGYLWMLINSFSGEMVFGIVPKDLTLHNWRFLWERPDPSYPNLWLTFLTTLFVGLGVAVVVVVVSTPAGYAISRLNFPGRASVLAFTLILHAFPGITLLISLYYVLRLLGLLNSIAGIVLVRSSLMIPFGIWVMKGFFDGIPWDIEMSALVDGATRFQTWYKVMLPLVKPGIAAISIFSFISGWSDYIFVVTFILRKQSWTLAGYVNSAIGGFRFVDYGLLAATAMFYILPVLLFFIFTQRYLMQVTIGGMKGGR